MGIGGIFAEVLKDFVLRVAPVSEAEALKMLAELKGYDYLLGKRDKKPINLKEVAKVIVALSNMGLENGEIKHRYKMNFLQNHESAEEELRLHLQRVCRGAELLEYAVQEV